MKESKGVNVFQHPPSPHFTEYSEYKSGGYLVGDCEWYVRKQDTGCQVNVKRDSCTCRMSNGKHHRPHKPRYFNTAPKHIYTYHGVKTSNTHIGLGSVKAVNRRKTQRVYIPDTEDRGIGSADLSSFFIRDRRFVNETESYYGSKRTSSKCVGGAIGEPTGIVDEKLSPIVKLCNAETGSRMLLSSDHNNDTAQIAENKHIISASPWESETNETSDKSDHEDDKDDLGQISHISRVTKARSKSYIPKKDTDNKFSSDSLIQHIHNLELSSNNKLSQGLVDPMENKLEREYRHMFESKTKQHVFESTSKQVQRKSTVHKSTSLLRRRFEALRRNHKKESKNEILVKPITKTPSKKDVSVTSDPPSLVARSYVSKPSSPPSLDPPKEFTTVEPDSELVIEDDDSSYNQSVLSMFRLWSKKLNLDESLNPIEGKLPKTQKIPKAKEQKDSKEEKKSHGKKFFFFKRKDKSKTQSEQTPCKNKKNVTANRCEIKEALVHKTPKTPKKRSPRVPSKQEFITAKYEEMFCKAWLSKFITNSSESNESAKIRWNNNTYTASSSTVFELMDTVYKGTGVVRRSKSVSSTILNYNQSTSKRVNFLQHNIEAWMIPQTITCSPMMIPVNANEPSSKDTSKNIAVVISKNKWAIDTARTFSHRIELVLHSNNIMKRNNKESSDFLQIDIPKGFFSDSTNSEEQQKYRISDEEVYKIVEYENLKSKSDIRTGVNYRIANRAFNEISVTVSVKDSKNNESKVLETVIKRRPTQRDVVIQGSRVSFPKRCDVIGVGIITQMKPILKMHENYSEEGSAPKTFTAKKKCEFAESYLQDYYRQWMPLGIDLYSSCRSNSKIKCSSEQNCILPRAIWAGSKSCPNIYDQYRTSGSQSSSEEDSYNPFCSQFMNEANSNIFYSKVKKNDKSGDKNTNLRVLPKDSTEVTRKRKTYACSNKAKWNDDSDDDNCCPGSPDMLSTRSSCEKKQSNKKKCNSKRVSLQDYDVHEPNKCVEVTGIIAYKGGACKPCKSDLKCSTKHPKVDSEPCEIQLHEPDSGLLTTPTKKFSPCHQKPQSTMSSKNSQDCCLPVNIPPCLKNLTCRENHPEPVPSQKYQEIVVPPPPQSCPPEYSVKRHSEYGTPSHQTPCPARASIVPMSTQQQSNPCLRKRECPPPCPPPPPPNFTFKKMENENQSGPASCTSGDTLYSTPTGKEKKSKSKSKSKKKKKEKANQVPCACPPSSGSHDCSSDCNQEYPWPMNNKVSVPPSPEYSKVEQRTQKHSHHSSNKPEKECKPDCANRRKLYKYVDSTELHQPSCPPPHLPYCPFSGPSGHQSSFAPPHCSGCPPHSLGYPHNSSAYHPIPAPYQSHAASPHCPHHSPKATPPHAMHCPKCLQSPSRAPPPAPQCPPLRPACPPPRPACPPLRPACPPPRPACASPPTVGPPPPSASTHHPHVCTDCRSNLPPPQYPSNPAVYSSTTECYVPYRSNTPPQVPLQSPCPPQNQTQPQNQCPPQNQYQSNNHCLPQNECPPRNQRQDQSQNQLPPQNQCPSRNQHPSHNQCHPQKQFQFKNQCPPQNQCPPLNQCPSQNQCPPQNQCLPQYECPNQKDKKHINPKEIKISPPSTPCMPSQTCMPRQSCIPPASTIAKPSCMKAKPRALVQPCMSPQPCTPPELDTQSPETSQETVRHGVPKPVSSCAPQQPTPAQAACQKQCRYYSKLLANLFPKKKKACGEEQITTVTTDIKGDSNHYIIRVTKSSSTDNKHQAIKIPKCKDKDPAMIGSIPQHNTQVATVLGSTYKTSSICHKVTSPAEDDKSSRSVQSIANVVELGFTLKVTQGEKLASLAYDHEGDVETIKKTQVIKTCSKEIYVVHPTETPEQVTIRDPNDINLHVVIKNFKRTDKNVSNEKELDVIQRNINFTNTICNKFHTVSTGYSEISRCNLNQAGTETSNIFSVHRATWDLTCSGENSKQSETSKETTLNKELNDMALQSVATITDTPNKSKTELKKISSESEQVSESKIDVDREYERDTGESGHPDQECSEETLSNSEIMSSDASRSFLLYIPPWLGRTKAERIRMLKIALDRARKMEHEDKLVKITNMLNAIVNSESIDFVNMNVSCKDLPKSPLSSNYKGSHSIKNLYGSRLGQSNEEKHDVTKNQSQTSKDSIESLTGCANNSCLCAVKTKPKEIGQGGWCCCRKPLKINIETNCDIRTSEDIFVLDYKRPILVDQETQRSKFMFSRANSFNVSFCESFVFRNSMPGGELGDKVESKEIDNEMPMTTSPDESQEEIEDSTTVLKISEENKLILASLAPTKDVNLTNPELKNTNALANLGIIRAAEILQCYETKKAVLEIYAEKTISEGRERVVAKLPKFAREKEREICEYGEITVERLQKEALCR